MCTFYTVQKLYVYNSILLCIGGDLAHGVTESKHVIIIRKQHSFNKRFKLLTTHINQHLTNANELINIKNQYSQRIT